MDWSTKDWDDLILRLWSERYVSWKTWEFEYCIESCGADTKALQLEYEITLQFKFVLHWGVNMNAASHSSGRGCPGQSSLELLSTGLQLTDTCKKLWWWAQSTNTGVISFYEHATMKVLFGKNIWAKHRTNL